MKILTVLVYLSSVYMCLSDCFIAVKGHHDRGNAYERTHLIGLIDSFRGLVRYYHGRKHGSVQTDMVLYEGISTLAQNGV